MRSLKICSAMIYFMAHGEKLSREQVFGNQGNPVYAIWPSGNEWLAAYHNGKSWESLTDSPARTEKNAFDQVAGHYFINF